VNIASLVKLAYTIQLPVVLSFRLEIPQLSHGRVSQHLVPLSKMDHQKNLKCGFCCVCVFHCERKVSVTLDFILFFLLQICGGSDHEEEFVVCPGCGCGHHVECLGILQDEELEEWLCEECTCLT
jgi:hypothetical protein